MDGGKRVLLSISRRRNFFDYTNQVTEQFSGELSRYSDIVHVTNSYLQIVNINQKKSKSNSLSFRSIYLTSHAPSLAATKTPTPIHTSPLETWIRQSVISLSHFPCTSIWRQGCTQEGHQGLSTSSPFREVFWDLVNIAMYCKVKKITQAGSKWYHSGSEDSGVHSICIAINVINDNCNIFLNEGN